MHKSARSAVWGMMAAGIIFGACALTPSRLQAQPTEVETVSGAALMQEGQAVLAPLFAKGINQLLGPYLPGVDLRTTNSNNPQNETTIDANRYNPLQVIGGFNDYAVLLRTTEVMQHRPSCGTALPAVGTDSGPLHSFSRPQ